MFQLADFRKVTCNLWAGGVDVFNEIYRHTNNEPCPGCGWYNKGNCPGYKQLSAGRSSYRPIPTETNAEIAARMGITKRAASKLRKEGKL